MSADSPPPSSEDNGLSFPELDNGGGRGFRPPFPDTGSSSGGNSSSNVNSKVMLASILSLSLVIVFVILLHIYARWLLRRQARRRAAIHGLALAARVNHDYPPGAGHQPPKTGLDPLVIASIPTFVFRQPDPEAAKDGTTAASDCAVCLSMLEDEEVVRLLPNCKHTFHVKCIDMWFASHSTCPLCRAQAQPAENPPAAPPLQRTGSVVSSGVEGPSSDGAGVSSNHKRSGSMTRLSSFRRMLSRERSMRIVQPEEDGARDIERQQ